MNSSQPLYSKTLTYEIEKSLVFCCGHPLRLQCIYCIQCVYKWKNLYFAMAGILIGICIHKRKWPWSGKNTKSPRLLQSFHTFNHSRFPSHSLSSTLKRQSLMVRLEGLLQTMAYNKRLLLVHCFLAWVGGNKKTL